MTKIVTKKSIAILLNIFLLLAVMWVINDDGFPHEFEGIVLVMIFIICPMANLWALHNQKTDNEQRTPSLISLYFKRKILEEKLKIEELTKGQK